MSPQPLQRPKRPNPPKSNADKPKSKPSNSKKIITSRGGGNNNRRGGGGGGGGNNSGGNSLPESPWLKSQPDPDPTASFVEYLRWMRSPGGNYDPDTKVQIMQLAQSNANYSDRLQTLTKRTKLIAGTGNWFEVQCPWRIRVGGHRGPESILLPAFDATGMPYLPSSTLRGVARTQAIRKKMQAEKVDWSTAEQLIAPYFGSLEAEASGRLGKVTFLDAYPLPSDTGGLEMDIATSIWNWDDDNRIEYKEPNPNVFFSLKGSKFIIGLRLSSNCEDTEVLDRVKQWLLAGLQQGIGSQVNTGYGELTEVNTKKNCDRQFFRLRFNVEGQLIHGHKEFNNPNQPYQKDRDGNYKTDKKGNLKSSDRAISEVRPTAFKSSLRYWFRAFSLGVLPPDTVREWEAQLFGAIQPKPTLGWVKVNIESGKLLEDEPRGDRDPAGEQQGIITLSYSAAVPSDRQKQVKSLSTVLMWLMFNLGGIGQGSRRPCYSRQNRQPRAYPPYHRGSTIFMDADLDDPKSFWYAPESAKEFQKLLRRRIREFYTALGQIIPNANFDSKIQSPLTLGSPTASQWYEAIDRNCRIIVCSGADRNEKPYALATLHDRSFKRGDRYNGDLCGETGTPSPVWVRDLEDYQIVTAFGVTASPRQEFIELLQKNADEYHQAFPF